jgi:hypothetical protein
MVYHFASWRLRWAESCFGGATVETVVQGDSRVRQHIALATLARGMAWGLIGGLAGTLVMDIVLMAGLAAAGMPALTCFSLVGDTAARFFALWGTEMAGGVRLGAAAHYLIGPAVGVLFGAILAGVKALRVGSMKKSVVAAVLYVEILGLPLLATTPILLGMTAAETLQWFGVSLVMHVILAVTLGVVVSRGLRVRTADS